MGALDGGECAEPFKVTWPSQVDDFKLRMNGHALRINAAVQECPALPPSEKGAWNLFFQNEWKPFAARKTPLFGSYNEWQATCGYSREMDGWLAKIASFCAVPGPREVAGRDNTLLTWGLPILAIGSLAVLGVVYAPTIKAALTRRR